MSIFRSPVRKKHGKSVSVLRLNTTCVPVEPYLSQTELTTSVKLIVEKTPRMPSN